MNNLQWFKDRIGKRIYRDDDNCTCGTCKTISSSGLIVTTENHAIYLHDVQNDYGAEGINLNYRDTK